MTARGEARRRMTGWMAARTKSGWATYASELEAEIARLRAALREIDSQLTNMQPHIASLEEHCGNVGRTGFVDDHVDAALEAARKALEGRDE